MDLKRIATNTSQAHFEGGQKCFQKIHTPHEFFFPSFRMTLLALVAAAVLAVVATAVDPRNTKVPQGHGVSLRDPP